MELLEVGKIINTHGLHGEVKVAYWTDYPEVFEDINVVYLPDSTHLTIKTVKYQKNNLIIKFAEIDKIEDAEKLKEKIIKAEKSELGELPEGVYYIADLIGLKVYEGERLLGKITDVFKTGANDVYEVRGESDKPILIPVIDSVVNSVDIKGGMVSVTLPEGLLDL